VLLALARAGSLRATDAVLVYFTFVVVLAAVIAGVLVEARLGSTGVRDARNRRVLTVAVTLLAQLRVIVLGGLQTGAAACAGGLVVTVVGALGGLALVSGRVGYVA